MATQEKTATAELLGNRLVVWDTQEGSELYRRGFYGKPVGVAKPKSTDFDSPLILGLIEGLYLLERKVIHVWQGPQQKRLSARKLRQYAGAIYDGFDFQYMVYRDLREKGYVVLPGIKFGCEYALYERGPGIDHSPYLVSVKGPDDQLTSTDIVRAGRLATSVRKKFIIAIPNAKTRRIQYLLFNWFKA
jgi:tRNA-intron endonuclease